MKYQVIFCRRINNKLTGQFFKIFLEVRYFCWSSPLISCIRLLLVTVSIDTRNHPSLWPPIFFSRLNLMAKHDKNDIYSKICSHNVDFKHLYSIITNNHSM